MTKFKELFDSKRIVSMLLCLCMIIGMIPTTGIVKAKAGTWMSVSDRLVDFIKAQEGFLPRVDPDYGNNSIGYGTACPPHLIEYYKTHDITREYAEYLLREFISDFEYHVNRRIIDHYGKQLNQHQFDALVSYTYNLGYAWMYNYQPSEHAFLNAVLYGDDSDIFQACCRYTFAGGSFLYGLMQRRLLEADMYVNGRYNTSRRPELGYVLYDATMGSVAIKRHGFDEGLNTKPIDPTTSRSDIKFSGWYTAATGGTKVEKLEGKYHQKTLYAHWEMVEDLEPGVDYVEVTMTTGGVNIRKGPGTGYGIVGTASAGLKFKIVETQTAGGLLWGRFSLGWIALKYTNYDEALKAKEEAAKAHVYGNLIAQVDAKHTATELQAGMKAHYFCTHCNKYFTTEKVETTKEALIIAAPTHNYNTQYGYKGADGHANTCSCGAHDTAVAHTPNISAPTEDAAQICTVCQYTIAAKLDHTHTNKLTKIDAVQATCYDNGNIEYYICSCGKWFTDYTATTEIPDHNTVVLSARHNLGELVVGTDPIHTATELKAGIQSYYYCATCDHYFTESYVEITQDDLVIPAPTHEYNIPNQYIGEDGHANACVCGKLDTVVEHTPNRDAATELDPVKCTICDYEIAPVLPHEHKYNLTKTEAQAADCVNNGNIAYYTCICGKIFKDSTARQELNSIDDTIIIAKHNYGTLVAKVDAVHTATELKAGMNAYYFCDKCDTYFTDKKVATTKDALVIEAPTHDYASINGYKAADGHANTCSCGAHDTVVAHTPNISAPTEEDDKKCSSCEYIIAPSLGHIHKNHLSKVEFKEATCTINGSVEHYACICGKNFADANAENEIETDVVIKASHEYKDEWIYDLDNHWHECSVCGNKNELSKHADSNADEKCDACSHPVLAAPTGSAISSGTIKSTGSLRVRAGAGSTYSTVGYYYKGDKVDIFEIKKVGSYSWARTKKGWISMDYVIVDDAEELPPTDTEIPEDADIIYGVIQTTGVLNVRSGPGSEYKVVGSVYHGAKVQITEKKLVGDTYWGKIDKGWISLEHVIVNKNNEPHYRPIEGDPNRTITASSLRVRAGAGTNYATITYVHRGTQVEILEVKLGTDGEQWGRIDRGWISLVYVE